MWYWDPGLAMCPRFLPLGPGSEPASTAPGGGRPSPGFALSSSRLATVHRQNSKPQDLRPALCLLRRPAEGKGCLQAEDGPLDSGRHHLWLTKHKVCPARSGCMPTLRVAWHPPGRWLVAPRWQIFVELRAGRHLTCSLDSIAFVSSRSPPVFSPQVRGTERSRLSVDLLRYMRLLLQRVPTRQTLLSPPITLRQPDVAERLAPDLYSVVSLRTGFRLGSICVTPRGSHKCYSTGCS